MIDRIARQIYERDFWGPTAPKWPEMTAIMRQPFRIRAREMIAALREPTEAMLIGARDWSLKKNGIGVGNDQATGCWQAMVDAVLAETMPESDAGSGASQPDDRPARP